MTSEGHNEPLMLRETREAPHVVRRLLTENREAVARLERVAEFDPDYLYLEDGAWAPTAAA